MSRLRIQPHHLSWASRPAASARRYSSQPPKKHTSVEIAALLAKPTWSVRSLLPNTHDPTVPLSVTPQKLHHLLRLSALPQPADKAEETSMLRTLEAQIHFVNAIQDVETTGVAPLRAIRDESREAMQESTIGSDTLKEALAKEETVGRRNQIRRLATTSSENGKNHIEREQWDGDALKYATKASGKFFVVEKQGGS